MCLLVVLSRVRAEYPLVVAANRDELLARPATAMTVLRDAGPRILGGRDELAGGTWLALNEKGVFAGLTNAPPSHGGRDPSKKSRGELPLALTVADRASDAVAAFRASVRASDYNPCWMLCGDREGVSYLDLTVPEAPEVEELGRGIHVLENRPRQAASPKVDAVRAALAGCEAWEAADLLPRLEALLRDHAVPDAARTMERGLRPLETEANCVHAGPYGTRSAEIVLVPAERASKPLVRFAAGPSCVTPWQDASFA